MVVVDFQALVSFGLIFCGNYPVMEIRLLRKQDFLLNVLSGTTPTPWQLFAEKLWKCFIKLELSLCYFFSKGIECLLLHISVLSMPPCTSVSSWVGNLSPSCCLREPSYLAAVLGKCSCAPPWVESVPKINQQQLKQRQCWSQHKEVFTKF